MRLPLLWKVRRRTVDSRRATKRNKLRTAKRRQRKMVRRRWMRKRRRRMTRKRVRKVPILRLGRRWDSSEAYFQAVVSRVILRRNKKHHL